MKYLYKLIILIKILDLKLIDKSTFYYIGRFFNRHFQLISKTQQQLSLIGVGV